MESVPVSLGIGNLAICCPEEAIAKINSEISERIVFLIKAGFGL